MRGADQQFKLAPEELLALERWTHPFTREQDHIDPVVYTALEIRAQVNRGERPAPEQVVGIFWAKGDGVFWTRQTRTWDLPSLTGVYAHRFTFKYIYSAWTTFPLIVKTQRRGRNAEGSTSDKWMGNIIQMRKEAVPFLESLGIPKPRSECLAHELVVGMTCVEPVHALGADTRLVPLELRSPDLGGARSSSGRTPPRCGSPGPP